MVTTQHQNQIELSSKYATQTTASTPAAMKQPGSDLHARCHAVNLYGSPAGQCLKIYGNMSVTKLKPCKAVLPDDATEADRQHERTQELSPYIGALSLNAKQACKGQTLKGAGLRSRTQTGRDVSCAWLCLMACTEGSANR